MGSTRSSSPYTTHRNRLLRCRGRGLMMKMKTKRQRPKKTMRRNLRVRHTSRMILLTRNKSDDI